MEQLDVYDEEGRPLGYTKRRNTRFQKGEYAKVIHVFLSDTKGNFLIQKRSATKQVHPGTWDVTQGLAVAGETSREAAVREVAEELGLFLSPEDFRSVGTAKFLNLIAELWYVRADFAIEDLVLQEEEVETVRLVTSEEMETAIAALPYRKPEYRELAHKILFEFTKNDET